MTAEEASLKLQKELGWTRTQADLHVSGSACLGMLKLEEPKSGNQRAREQFKNENLGGYDAEIYLGAIERAGLKIVEK